MDAVSTREPGDPRRYYKHGRGFRYRAGADRGRPTDPGRPQGDRADACRHQNAGHHPRRHGARAERRRGIRPGRTRPGGVLSRTSLRDRSGRDVADVRRHRYPPGDPGYPGFQPFRTAGQRRRRHPPGAPPRHSRRRGRAAAGQQPGRDLREARSGRAEFGDGGRCAAGGAGFSGDHRASHRDPPAHRLRHPAPDHRADATARGRAHRDQRRPQHRARVTPSGADAVADRAHPVVPAEDLRRDRGGPALLPGGAIRGDPAGQCRCSGGVTGSLARRRTAFRADPATRIVDRRRPRREPERDGRRGAPGHRQRRVHRAGAPPGRTRRSRAGVVDVGATGQLHPRAGCAGRRLPGGPPGRRAVPAGVAGDPRAAHRDRRRDPGPATAG